MTENKRYRVFKYIDCEKYGVSDDVAEYTLARFDNHFEAEGLCDLLNELAEENEQLKKDRFICLDCEHSGYTEIGCLCEYNDHWQEHITECEDFKGLRE